MKSNVKFPLKHKIRIALAISILLCSVTTLSVAMFLFSKAIRTSTQNGLKNTIAGWNSEISQMETFLKAAAQSVSNNNSLRKSMALGDYSEISGILNFEIKNFDFDYLSVLDMNGNVVASGKPSHMDNNFGSLSIISNALRGNTTVNYETPANTKNFSLMAACPVTEPEFGRVIGAIVTGYDLVSRAMANSIKFRYGSECTIFENDLRVNTTLSDKSGRALAGTKLQNPEIRKQVIDLQNNYYGDTTIYQKKYLAAYAPLKGLHGEFKGMIFVADDISIITAIQRKALSILIPILAVIVMIVFVLATIFIRKILRPMYALQLSFGKMAKGDLTDRIDSDSKDELGLLVKEFNSFSNEINKTISDVKRARDNLRVSGDIMNGSTENTASAITQIASSIDSIKQQIFNQTSSVSQTVGAVQQISTSITTLESMIENQSSGVAEASAQSRTIGEQLAKIQESIKDVVEASGDTNAALMSVSNRIKETDSLVYQIKIAMNEQNEGSKQISEALKYMNDSTSEVRNASKEMTEGNSLILNEIKTLQQSTHSISSNMEEVSIGTDRIQEAGESLRTTSISVHDSILAIGEKIDVFTVA